MALFSRVKNWVSGDSLLAIDLNAEFDNLISNMIPQSIVGYSATVNQMRTQTDPGESGTESLATSMAGELERLRFALTEIKGTTYWYQSSTTSLAQLASALGSSSLSNRVSSGLTQSTSSQPIFLKPDGSAATVTLKAASTPLVYSIAGIQYTISTDVSVTSLTVAPGTNNTCVVSDTSVSAQAWTKLLGENGSTITVSAMGSSVSSLIGQIAAFKTANGTAEYVLCRVISTTQLQQVYRGYFFNSSNALMGRQTVNNGDTLTLMKLTWIYATTGLGLTVAYTNPTYSGTAPTSPSTGDYWFDIVNNIWKVYNSTTWVAANATLIGTCIQNGTATVGARSTDFFKSYTDVNTIELFQESATNVRAKNIGGQANVYGTVVSFGQSYPSWATSSLDAGVSLTASTFYYVYVTEAGNTVISDIAPFDRRGDLRGFYHPANTYRCLGYVYYNAAPAFAEVESFYRATEDRQISTLTAAVASYPFPYGIEPREQFYNMDASGSAFTQVLPPPSTWKGQQLTYTKRDSTLNAVTLQAFGTLILTTTLNTTIASTAVSTLASTAGLVSGTSYLVSGAGIPLGTTIVWTSSTTAVLSQNANATASTVTVIIAQCPNITAVSFPSAGIGGNFTTTLNTQGESVTLLSDGNFATIISRYIPSISLKYTPAFGTGFGTVTIQDAWSCRRGEKLCGYVAWTVGTVAASPATVTIGYGASGNVTADTTKIATTQAVGTYGSSNANAIGVLIIAGGAFVLNLTNAIGGGLAASNASSLFSTAATGKLFYEVTIQGWNG